MTNKQTYADWIKWKIPMGAAFLHAMVAILVALIILAVWARSD